MPCFAKTMYCMIFSGLCTLRNLLKSMAGEDILVNSIDSGGDKTYSANQICEMVEFFIDNIFVKVWGTHF